MIPVVRVLAIATLLYLIPLQNVVAAAYKWVDGQGETHYSQLPPAATTVEVIKPPPAAADTAPQIDTASPESGAANPSDAAKAEDTAIRAKNCTVARNNLAALQSANAVTIKDTNGLLHTLTPAERAAHTEDAEKNIKDFCKE